MVIFCNLQCGRRMYTHTPPNFVLVLLCTTTICCSVVVAVDFQYGEHFPNGKAAVLHAYNLDSGTWKRMSPISYVWNYYEQYATPTHPYDKGALIAAANGSAFYTTRDANGYLLCDHDHDLEIDEELRGNCGYAFHEHNGIGVNGTRRGNPFTNFWLDDNWLARYMSQAYGRPEPSGLSDQNGFMRWKPIGGDPTNWVLYNSMHFDTLALDGLYYIAVDNVQAAIVNWETSVRMSGANYDQNAREFKYPNIEENYHVGLFKILTDQLLAHGGRHLHPDLTSLLVQHSIALRSHILSHQERDSVSGSLLGWTSHVEGGSSLINTESISCNVLALGVGARYVLETVGSTPGASYPKSSLILNGGSVYRAEFLVRSARPLDGTVFCAVTDVTNSNMAVRLSTRIVNADDFDGPDAWTSFPLEFQVPGSGGRGIEFEIYWIANGPELDVSTSITKVHLVEL